MRAYLWATFLAAGLIPATAGDAVLRQPTKAEQVFQEFDIFKDGDVLLVPVTLKGKEYLFSLDTGSTLSVYDTSLTHLLGEPKGAKVGATPNGDVKVTLYDPPQAFLGRLALRSAIPVVTADLARLRRVSGHAIYGVIGMNYLGGQVVRIDFDRGKATFLREVGPNPGRPIELSSRSDLPSIDLRVSGLPAALPFIVDTGCVRYGGIRPDLFRQLVERGKLTLSGVNRSVTLKGVSVSKKGRLGAVSLGDFTHRNLVFEESHFNTLGLDFLSRYVVTFDFPNGTAYLKKGASFDRPPRDNLSGLHLGRVTGRTVIDSVEEGSPAATAGLKPGDEVVAVAGKRANGLRMFAIHVLLCEAKGKTLEVTVRREGMERAVSMMLQRPKRPGTVDD